ncbi:general substrate transporter [Dacryopinax primogenitus]|uniref:General substrate transporter n=1 Tax=Dacryopinax primogenitus (strain DJM 731) TaxID=1858805 RepID=M5FW46_DACPD|nr:general substrate transporter [Dacryopinax primogenitus]EJU00589.1 general substrate transporter [Dacryopinax primogenitus]
MSTFSYGYDTGIAGGVVSNPYFQQVFGLDAGNANDLSSNIVSVLQAGAFFGALGSAPLSGWIGRRWTLIICSLVFILGAILTTVAESQNVRGLSYIYSGRVISGLGIGAISSVGPTYATEIAPKNIRGKITGLFQVWVAAGVLLSYWVNYGVSIHSPPNSPQVWRIPFGVQILPAGLMALFLLFCRDTPRFLALKGRRQEALDTLCWYRRASPLDDEVKEEFAETEATVLEEKGVRAGLTFREAVFGKGNWPRYIIAFVFMLLQQFSGQNIVGYYGPQLFKSIGYVGQTPALLASGVYGIVKLVATALFIAFGVDRFGRRWALFGSAWGMGITFMIVGAIYLTHPPNPNSPNPSGYSQAMAAMIYLFCVAYSWGIGPLPFLYCSEIFSNRTRHIGMAWSGMSQWLFNFTISRIALDMETALGGKVFITFGAINIGGMATFAYFIPETKGKSLEEMDIIFGSVKAEDRNKEIERAGLEYAADMKRTDPEKGAVVRQPEMTEAPKPETAHIDNSA